MEGQKHTKLPTKIKNHCKRSRILKKISLKRRILNTLLINKYIGQQYFKKNFSSLITSLFVFSVLKNYKKPVFISCIQINLQKKSFIKLITECNCTEGTRNRAAII